MSIMQRGVIFAFGTVSNAILFVFHSRVILTILDMATNFGTGPATDALNLIPTVMPLAIGGIQAILVVYLLGGLQDQRSVQRRPG